MLSLALTIFLFQRSYAQTDKGTFTLGGNVAAGIWKPRVYDMSSLRITSTAGFFIRNNTLIGIGVPVESGEMQFNQVGPSSNVPTISGTSVGLSLVARRYFLEGRVKPFVHLDGSYNWTKSDAYRSPQDLRPETRDGQTIKADAGFGVSYFLSQRFSLEATVTMGIANVKSVLNTKTLDPTNRYLLLGIGGNWYLPGKPKR